MNTIITVNDAEEEITRPIEILRSLRKWQYPELEEIEGVIFGKGTNAAMPYSYGDRIFNYGKSKNQLDSYIIPLLKKEPFSRRAIITIYDPLEDSKVASRAIPGIISMYFKIIEGKLTLTITIRSNDVLIGWPANIYQAHLLQKYVAEKIGVLRGSITTISHSTHIYEDCSEELGKVLAEA
jgi:thymidylate synthase